MKKDDVAVAKDERNAFLDIKSDFSSTTPEKIRLTTFLIVHKRSSVFFHITFPKLLLRGKICVRMNDGINEKIVDSSI